MRTVLGVGAAGGLVKQVQAQLTASGFNTQALDGVYGNDTATAMKGFQAAHGVTPTGTLDDGTWGSLMNAPVPPVAARSLELTAAFEGHGYTLAMGNFDGALLTWGIIGFTMGAGEVQKIVLGVNATNPQSVQAAFGSDAQQLLSILQDTRANQTAWANTVTLPNGTLAEPWRDEFAAFGSDPVVQAAQLALVNTEYTRAAIALAKSYGLVSETGLALCFDIQVQDGGISLIAAQRIATQRASAPNDAALLPIIAEAVAVASNSKWSSDVLARKMAIARGGGPVHGRNYVLDSWGLNVAYPAAELS